MPYKVKNEKLTCLPLAGGRIPAVDRSGAVSVAVAAVVVATVAVAAVAVAVTTVAVTADAVAAVVVPDVVMLAVVAAVTLPDGAACNEIPGNELHEEINPQPIYSISLYKTIIHTKP